MAAEQIGGSVVIKAQLLAGGRGKCAAVQFAFIREQVSATAKKLLQSRFNGQRAGRVLVQPAEWSDYR